MGKNPKKPHFSGFLEYCTQKNQFVQEKIGKKFLKIRAWGVPLYIFVKVVYYNLKNLKNS